MLWKGTMVELSDPSVQEQKKFASKYYLYYITLPLMENHSPSHGSLNLSVSATMPTYPGCSFGSTHSSCTKTNVIVL